MIDFELSEEQKMIRKTTREFAERELTHEVIREYERQRMFPYEIIKKMVPIGLTGTTVPAEYGGAAVDWIAHGLVSEEIGRVWFSLCLTVQLVQVGLVEMPIVWYGNDAQKQKYVPSLVRAEKIGCVCAVEPNVGSNGTAVETMATPDGNCWVLNGSKVWITNAGVADIYLVLCQTDKSKGTGGLAVFVLEKGTPGLTVKNIEWKTGVWCNPTSEVSIVDCRVPEENLIGKIGRGFQIIMSGINNVRYSLSAGCTGMAQGCIDACIRYARERVQFGKPIGSFQLIQEKIADMIVETEASRLLYLRAGYLKDRGLPFRRELSIAKIYATELALRASTNAIKIHGAYGYCDEFPVERHFRDVMAPTIFGGTNEMHRLILGREALGIDAFR